MDDERYVMNISVDFIHDLMIEINMFASLSCESKKNNEN